MLITLSQGGLLLSTVGFQSMTWSLMITTQVVAVYSCPMMQHWIIMHMVQRNSTTCKWTNVFKCFPRPFEIFFKSPCEVVFLLQGTCPGWIQGMPQKWPYTLKLAVTPTNIFTLRSSPWDVITLSNPSCTSHQVLLREFINQMHSKYHLWKGHQTRNKTRQSIPLAQDVVLEKTWWCTVKQLCTLIQTTSPINHVVECLHLYFWATGLQQWNTIYIKATHTTWSRHVMALGSHVAFSWDYFTLCAANLLM